jgi:acyl carrier protein
MNTEQRLKALLAETVGCDPDQIKITDHLVHDLNMDSLSLVEIVMSIENEFDIVIESDEADRSSTVALIQDLVESKLRK